MKAWTKAHHMLCVLDDKSYGSASSKCQVPPVPEVKKKAVCQMCDGKTCSSTTVVALPLTNGWVPYGHSYGTPSVVIENGLCVVNGLVKSGKWGNIATLPSSCRPSKRLIFNVNNHQKTARVDVLASDVVSWVTGGQDHSWISLTGIVFVLGGGETSLNLSNGWVPYGHSYSTPSLAIKNGLCIVSGLAKSGKWGNIATLPSSCRPSKRLIFNVNNHAKTARVDVQTSGVVSWHAGGKDHSWISLTGIVFALDGETTLTMSNGWVAYGGSYGSPSMAIKSGVCIVSGLVKSGAWNTIATLPASCRSTKRLIFNLNNHENPARVDVQTSGV